MFAAVGPPNPFAPVASPTVDSFAWFPSVVLECPLTGRLQAGNYFLLLGLRMVVIRCIVIAAVGVLLAMVVRNHDHGAIKGMPVPMANIVYSVVVSVVVAAICKMRFKRLAGRMATPFVAGIAGSFGILSASYGPYGGILGLLVGTIVLLLPFGSISARYRAAFNLSSHA